MFRTAIILIISHIHYSRLAPTESYPYSESLASKYMLYWKYNDTHITFETHVDALGYTGFGISKNGSMFPGDVVVGYVNHNKASLTDYHTTAYAPPTIDNSQDWLLLSGKVTQGSTVLKFARALNTHDDNDVPIHVSEAHWPNSKHGSFEFESVWNSTTASSADESTGKKPGSSRTNAGVTHVIWSYTDNQPQNLTYHGGVNRGSKDIKLIVGGTVPVGK